MSKQTQKLIKEECDAIKAMLVDKNEQYGDSALSPLAVASCDEGALEKIAVRIDDKLARMQNKGGLVACFVDTEGGGEDTVQDLIGYLILARAAFSVQGVT